jgi:polyisoprenoid-binding protein YceI
MKKVIIILLLLPVMVNAQKYITKTGKITFDSDAPLEKIEAVNNQVNAAIDMGTGDIVFKVLMKSFEFQKSMMQDHFNENYVESDKYPNSTFIGKITNISSIDPSMNGTQAVSVVGKLTIKDSTRNIKADGTVEIKDGKIIGYSKFTILLSDYGIKIPSVVTDNISRTIDINVNVILTKLN